MIFMALMPASFRSRLARWNFSFSWVSRTKDLTTRTLVMFSCTVEFSPSIFSCIRENRGKPLEMMIPTTTSITGMLTRNTMDREGRMAIAMIRAAIIIPGARSASRSSILTKFCNWVTSLVSRVTSEPVENLSMLAKEYFCTLA